MDYMLKVVKRPEGLLASQAMPQWPKEMHSKWRTLLSRCLDTRPEKRVNSQQLVEVLSWVPDVFDKEMSTQQMQSKGLHAVEEVFKLNEIAVKKYEITNIKDLEDKDDEEIGEGGFGVIYRSKLRGEEVAVKVSKEGKEKSLVEEMTILANISHENIIALKGWILHEKKFLLIW